MSAQFPYYADNYPELSKIVAFHDLTESGNFYQEALVPFFLMLMSIRAGRPQNNTISIFTPDIQVSLPPSFVAVSREKENQHWHNCFEFTYVVEGSMYQIVEGKRYYYPTGSCCLMNRNTLHTEEVSTDFTCIFLSFTVEFIARLTNYGRSLLFPNEQEIFDNLLFRFMERNLGDTDIDSKDFLDFVPKSSQNEQIKLVHQIFEDMLYTLLIPGYGATYQMLMLLTRFIGILGNKEYYNAEHVTSQTNMETLLLSRIDRILDERHGRITHRELAELLNYNGSYIGRIVKKYTGKSLFDYSMDFTMNYVADELRHTDKTASQIANELRFSNHTHFYSIFKERFGMTPQDYRQNRQK